MYDKIRDAYVGVAQIQLDTWMQIKADFEDFREQAALVRGVYSGGVCRGGVCRGGVYSGGVCRGGVCRGGW